MFQVHQGTFRTDFTTHQKTTTPETNIRPSTKNNQLHIHKLRNCYKIATKQQLLQNSTEQLNDMKENLAIIIADILISVLPSSTRSSVSSDKNIVTTITTKLKIHMGLNLIDSDLQTALRRRSMETPPPTNMWKQKKQK